MPKSPPRGDADLFAQFAAAIASLTSTNDEIEQQQERDDEPARGFAAADPSAAR